MKKEYLPYYLSRAVLSAVVAMAVAGFTWGGLLVALFFYCLFLLYLHSGWFSIDLTYPLFPLRRDQRAELIQRKAIIAALLVGVLSDVALHYASGLVAGTFLSANPALPSAIVIYFTAQFVLLWRG